LRCGGMPRHRQGRMPMLNQKWPADKVERRRGARERTCCDCGNVDSVRTDYKALRCAACSRKANGAKGSQAIVDAALSREKDCESCGDRHRNKRFCSVKCKRDSAERTARECKHCGLAFDVLASTIKTSNASGNFCSRGCYETFLCRTGRVTGRGSQWKRIRAEAIKKAPFCAICGTTKSLQVHHIIPFRISRDNAQNNLIPLCVKHHRWVETILVETESFGFDATSKIAWVGMLKERQMATAAKIMEVIRADI